MVKLTLKNGASFLFQTQKTIISAASIISIMYAVAAVLSFVRTRFLSSYFGASNHLGVFFTADRIPAFISNILVVGTLSAVFIPVFTSYLKKDEDEAWRISSSIINISLLAFLLIGILSFIFARELMMLLSLGNLNGEELILGQNLMRIMIVAQIILIFSSFITSVLQSFKYFIVPAIAPVLYNMGMILGIIILTPWLGIYGAAYGVVVGALMHLLIQLPLLRRVNYRHSFNIDFKDPGVKEVFRLMPSRVVSSAINQISAVIDTSLAFLVSTSSVVIFKFSDQLQSFPVNLFGASIALAALPTLAYESDDQKYEKFKETFLTSLHQMLFLVIPAAIILLVLRVPMVRLVYGASKFPWEATIATSYTVAFFSLSIFSQSAVYLITRAFYALHDTKTPLKVTLFTIPFDVLISLSMVKLLGWGVWSIAFSFSISSIMDFIIMIFLLHKKVDGFDLEALFSPFVKISYAALFMGISLYVPLKLLEKYVFDTTHTLPLIVLTMAVCICGFLSYLLFTKIFNVKEVKLLYGILGKFRVKRSVEAAANITTGSSETLPTT